mgnify:CR=1 FL=1
MKFLLNIEFWCKNCNFDQRLKFLSKIEKIFVKKWNLVKKWNRGQQLNFCQKLTFESKNWISGEKSKYGSKIVIILNFFIISITLWNPPTRFFLFNFFQRKQKMALKEILSVFYIFFNVLQNFVLLRLIYWIAAKTHQKTIVQLIQHFFFILFNLFFQLFWFWPTHNFYPQLFF